MCAITSVSLWSKPTAHTVIELIEENLVYRRSYPDIDILRTNWKQASVKR